MIDRPNSYAIDAYTLGGSRPFTKSNGTILSRIYERLTKASRRRASEFTGTKSRVRKREDSYRQGVYDTLKALQNELS